MIRHYTPSDKPQLIELIKLNTPQYFDESEESEFRTYLDSEVDDYFVVEEQNKIVGSGGINYFFAIGEARLAWDMIHPDYQGKGIGKSLTNHRIDIIKKQTAARTIVVRTTQLAYQFYEKVGFELINTEKDFWAKGFDLYYMVIELNDTITRK